MLLGFTVENFRSFLEETSLSMVASSDKELREFNVIPTNHDDLLKSILIYGANASGKSNLIQALSYMKKMIVSPIDVQTEHIKTCSPFTFRVDAKSRPTKFEISFLLDQIIYDYGFDILAGQINREYLYKKAKRRTLVFERTAPDYRSIELTPDMSDVEPLKKNVRSDVLFLSWAAFANNALAIKIVNWITSGLIIIGKNDSNDAAEKILGNMSQALLLLASRLSGQPEENAKAIEGLAQSFVRKADSDILEIKQRSDGSLISSHKLYKKDWSISKNTDVLFDDYSSDGTKRMFDLSLPFSQAILEPTVIIVDEMDLHLHPALVRHLLSLINSIEHNSKNAQLICTTHDVMLLDEDIRRDQIWFVDKNEHGVSSLSSLSDFKDVRKNSDILKRYLLGVYGGVPDLSRGERHE